MCHAENIDILGVNPSGFDRGIKENNLIRALVKGAFSNYQELNPDSEVFTRGRVKMPHPEYYSGAPDLKKFEVFIVGILQWLSTSLVLGSDKESTAV